MMKNASFLPEDYVEQRAQRRANVLCLLLFLAVMCGIAGAVFVSERDYKQAVSVQMDVNQRFEEAARRIDQLDQLQQRREEMVRKAQVTSNLVERVPRTLILSELINNMPANVSLLKLDLSTKVIKARTMATTALEQQRQDQAKAVAAPEMDEMEVSLDVVGVAPTDLHVAQFMTSLGKGAMFRDLNLAYSEETTIEGTKLRSFRIEMKLSPDIDMQKIEPKLVKRELKQNPMAGTMQINSKGQFTSPGKAPERPRAVPAADR